MQEYKKQGIFVLLGLVVLLFPFSKTLFLVLFFFGGALLFSNMSIRSYVFEFLARESDIKSGKLTHFIHLFFTTGILLLISLIIQPERFPLFIIGCAFAITTFGDGISDIIDTFEKTKHTGSDFKDDINPFSAKSSLAFLISGSIYSFLAGAWILVWSGPGISFGMIFFLSVLGANTGALLKSMVMSDDKIIIPFGSAMTMWLFYTFSFSYNVGTLYLVEVLGFAFALGYLAYKVRIADISAMLSATLLGVVIITATNNITWFLTLLSFFLLGGLFTRYKYNYKRSRGLAEAKGGVRGYKNVFSNSLAALCLAVGYGVFPSYGQIILAAYLGSIATATGDTLASEIGQTYKGEPRMITTLEKAPVGTDGAISHLGEVASLFGASVIAVLTLIFIQEDLTLAMAVVAGGFIGTNIDSVLGATLQRKGYLSNNGVNLFATISGAIISGLIFHLMGS